MANLETKITLTAVDKTSSAFRAVGSSITKLKAAAAGMSASFSNLGNAAGNFGQRMRNLGFVVAAAGAGIFGAVKAYSDLGETLNLTSQKTGVSIQNLQKLGYAAELGKVSADELRMSLQFLNRSMAMARGDSKSPQAEMFKKLGIDVKKTTDTTEVFLKMSEKFKNNSNIQEKTLFSRGLMGRPGINLIPIMNQGAEEIKKQGEEFARISHVFTDEEAQAADEFGDHLQKLSISVKGLALTVGQQLVPVLKPLIIEFTDYVAANKELVKTNVKEFITSTVEVFKALAEVIKAVRTILSPLSEQLGGMGGVVKVLAAVYVTSLIVSLGKVVVALYGFGASIATAMGAVWGLNAAILACPITWIIAGIAALAVAGYMLYKHWDEVKAWWIKMWTEIPSIVKTAIRIIASIVTLGMSEVVLTLMTKIEGLKASINGVIDWASTKYQQIKGLFGGEEAKNTGLFSGMKSDIDATQSLTGKLGQAFKDASVETLKSMHPVSAMLGGVYDSVVRINSALKGLGGEKVSIGVQGAGAAPATPPSATPRLSQPQLGPAPGQQRTQLDVFMKIDADGRPKDVKAKSSAPMSFAANAGVMI